MSAEFAYQKADKHLCVALHRKVCIRLHPSYESICGKQREKSEDNDCNSLYEIDGICRQLR